MTTVWDGPSGGPVAAIIDRTTATDTEFVERIAAFDTASVPAEIVREQVARALYEATPQDVRWIAVAHDSWIRASYYRMADAALAVVAQQPHPAVQLAEWLVSLDDDDPESPGRQDRRTVTLTKITDRARAVLAGDPR